MDIRIYDPPEAGSPTFRGAGRVTEATSVSLTWRWTRPGYFTLEVPWEARHAGELHKGRLVSVGDFWGIIDALNLNWDAAGAVLTVTGRQLKGLTEDRITVPPSFTGVSGAQGYDVANGTTEAIMKHYVRANMGPEAVQARRILGLVIAADQGRGLTGDKYMSRHECLADVLSALGETAGLGYDIVPELDSGTFVFDVVPGEDHRAAQSQRKRVVFDIQRKTALGQAYSSSDEDAGNLFYATMSGAEFADEALTVTYVRDGEGTPTGIRRREKHLSVSVSTPEAGTEYDELRRQALIEAEDYRSAESFTCQVSEGLYVFGQDYRVGDLVTVQNQAWGVRMDTHITEMQMQWNGQGRSLTATFGTAPLNVFGKLKRQIKRGG